MIYDEQLLADIPDVLSVSTLLKATPKEEGGERFIYFEASNEGLDLQGERVLAKALEESAEYFLKFGNIDIDHFTLLGPKAGVPNYMSYEIGRPVDVAVKGTQTFVKAQLYQGDTDLARNANMVWESMTKVNPPARWYPSVGGAVLAKSLAIDPETKSKVGVVTKVRWNNIALSRTPVNPNLPEASTAPVAVFAKSLNGFVMSKSLTAGYGTDVATLTGGSALRMQSLDGAPQSYFDFRDKLAKAMNGRELPLTSADMVTFSVKKFGLQPDEATHWVDRFLGDLKSSLKQKRSLQ